MNEMSDNKRKSEEKQKSSDTQDDSVRNVRRAKAIARFRPEYVGLLREHLRTNSFFSFGGVVRENSETLYLWVANFPEFRAAREEFKTSRPVSIYAQVSK